MNSLNKKPRMGIITFHRSINYGTLLQTFALQEAFKLMGCECNIIDYRCESMEKSLNYKFTNCKNMREIATFIAYSKYEKEKIKKFREFSTRYLNLSSAYYNIEELKEIEAEYDQFICGSDQVWNYNITNSDQAYFLSFLNNKAKKNSYAASFGIANIPVEYIDTYKLLLESFDNISVRENQGKKIIKDIINRDAELVLDPTLLLTSEDWGKISKQYTRKKNYILIYAFTNSPTIISFASKLAKQTGCDIVCISYSWLKRINATYEKYVGPTEFLGLFKNARYVITNSFHGTCFSIIFNKDFFLEMLPESRGVNSRLENILDIFELRSRQIINGENSFIHEHIDYDDINNEIIFHRTRSFNFIDRIINH